MHQTGGHFPNLYAGTHKTAGMQSEEKVMKALEVRAGGLIVAERSVPAPAADEILVRVHAAGVTPTELLWYPTTHEADGSPRLAAVPGHEFSGAIEAAGAKVTEFSIGDAVFGLNDWFRDGATAEFCITSPGLVASKPLRLSHAEAATVPIGALTAWQGLFDKAKVEAGETVLIHGGAGAVGMFAVQLAHQRGAHVIATASATAIRFVEALGADRVIDYASSRFDSQLKDIDVVFDTVGGETRDRSWPVLRRDKGRLVTIAADAESSSDQRVTDSFLLVAPNHEQLKEIARRLDAGQLKTFVKAAVPLDEAAEAYSGKVHAKAGAGFGKVIIAVMA